MRFDIDHDLLRQCHATLSPLENLYWILGGAGSGKTAISQSLSSRFSIPVYDMDAHIYGAYHSRFTTARHPVNSAWSVAQNGLAWLLDMSWDEFNHFNQAALVEYLDLLSKDVRGSYAGQALIIDGGVCNPSVLVQALSPSQMVCLVNPAQSSREIWEGSDERRAMKEFVVQLPNPQEAWQTFLEFDEKITSTIRQECQENQIAVLERTADESVADLTTRVAHVLGMP